MKPPPAAADGDWVARVTEAGVRLDLWDGQFDDQEVVLLCETILRAGLESRLSDEDLYPLLVRLWSGRWPQVDWPPDAPALTRRCATKLAAKGSSVVDAMLCAPSNDSRNAAREAIVADLNLTTGALLSVLADHWEELADAEMPIDGGRTLLAFARDVLLEPIVSACAMLWSTLDSAPGSVNATATIASEEWSPLDNDDWIDLAVSEVARLGDPVPDMPIDGEQASALLAAARARILADPGASPAVAESLVRTSGWPGATDLIDPLASRALGLALERIDDVDPQTDNDDIVDSIQLRLMPPDDNLLAWVRDPSFGTLGDHSGASRTRAKLLHEAAYWLTWSVMHDAVDAVAATRARRPDA